ncbi:MAG: tRNA (adenosine(37)-N6)-threonylcarbamoyltransferase complex ATPase subunit type 1 TsaE [Christensenellales bacterium]
MEKITNNRDETLNFAENLAKQIVAPKIIVLSGDLGAGKTTFSKGFAKGLGISETITSPTFTLLNEYSGDKNLYHFDMYRLSSKEEAYELGFENYFENNDGIILVEWAENVKGLFTPPYLKILIEKIDENKRKFTLEEIV